ncbi:hypothetical protein [Asanoa iriomotensis]|uniref:Uncharacterized protein n=1 Tax=Asanoa iriomotensis TaxID=234613 RepID=A0ABQ4CEN2_9ACTN|nr:hypothetical protein [Asanoa iriomotensis]GIF61237.1 hypothetical protein Air01nite_73320 [Asanoa iriomotensis]
MVDDDDLRDVAPEPAPALVSRQAMDRDDVARGDWSATLADQSTDPDYVA